MKQFEILSSSRFHQRMAREFTVGRIHGVRSYIGLSLKEDSRHLLEPEPTISIRTSRSEDRKGRPEILQ